MFNISPAPAALAQRVNQGLFLGLRHVLALASAARLRFERLDPTVVIGHVRPVHRARRHAYRRCNQWLRHLALARQHHLDAPTLLGGYFPSRRCFQPPDLALGAFDHLFPPNQMIRGNHTLRPEDKSLRCPLHGTASASIQSAMEAVLFYRY
jgi:hypothetical protein